MQRLGGAVGDRPVAVNKSKKVYLRLGETR